LEMLCDYGRCPMSTYRVVQLKVSPDIQDAAISNQKLLYIYSDVVHGVVR